MGTTVIVAHVYHADDVSIEYHYDGPEEDLDSDFIITHGLYIVRQIVNLAERPYGLQLRSNLRQLAAGKPVGPGMRPYKEPMKAKHRFGCVYFNEHTGVDFGLDAFGFPWYAGGKLDKFAAASTMAVAISGLEMLEDHDSYPEMAEFIHRIAANAESFTIRGQLIETLYLLRSVMLDFVEAYESELGYDAP